MYNLFNEPFAEIFRGTTMGQRMSIINFLLFTAGCDAAKDNSKQETELVSKYARILKVEGSKSKSYFGIGKWPCLITDIQTLSQTQKEFFILMVFEMVNCDGQMNDKEERFLNKYFERVGFSETMVLNTITKAQAITRDLFI